MEKKIVIQGKDLSIGYRTGKKEKIVHQHLNFQLHAGELTCLLGANGAGKSTLLRTLSASQPSLAGELHILNKPVSEYTEKERSRTIGVVLTDKTFTGGLSVYELVALGRQPHTGFFGRLTKEDRRIVEEAMENVGIAHKAKNYTAELSDGERQKVMIAKALVQECPLILLDEPTAFLDVVSRIEIMRHEYDSKQLVSLCTVLPKVLKYKGSLKAVLIAAQAILSSNGIKQRLDYAIENGNSKLVLYVSSYLTNLNLLYDLMDYILPAGMSFEIIQELSSNVDLVTEFSIESDVTVQFKPTKEFT